MDSDLGIFDALRQFSGFSKKKKKRGQVFVVSMERLKFQNSYYWKLH